MPKYSLVLPVLDGAETLPITLAHLNKCPYKDLEVVISNNRSSDQTKYIVESFDDPRFKLVEPPNRLGWSENLAFAYQHAAKASGNFI